MKHINFEMKRKESSLAIRGPTTESFTESVSTSVAFAHAHDKIMDARKDNILNLLDSVLRRNREGEDDDDVLIDDDDEIKDVVTGEMNGFDSMAVKRGKMDFFYNREQHKLTKIFFLIA